MLFCGRFRKRDRWKVERMKNPRVREIGGEKWERKGERGGIK